VILGGAALYLAGNLLFKLAIVGTIAWSRVLALAALALLAPLGAAVDRLVLSAAAALVVAALAASAGWGSAGANWE
jgi:low temperature requirement protein LtrA